MVINKDDKKESINGLNTTFIKLMKDVRALVNPNNITKNS